MDSGARKMRTAAIRVLVSKPVLRDNELGCLERESGDDYANRDPVREQE